MFFKYTDKIDKIRGDLPLYWNFPHRQVLCIERENIGKNNESTVVTLNRPSGNGTGTLSWTLEISRAQHAALFEMVVGNRVNTKST